MHDDIRFLKELQKELQTQEHDCQAEPRYWTIGDYVMVSCPEGYQESYEVYLPESCFSCNVDEYLDTVKTDELEDMSEDAKREFKEIGCEVSALEWIQKYQSKDASLIPVQEEHIIRPNTMFLTKAEAKRHLELNHYHYSKKAHTYAMTAWRAPKVERLLKILETFDWGRKDETR